MSPSPTAKPSKSIFYASATMTFPQAIEEIMAEKRITKLEWQDSECYGQLRGGILMLYRDDEWFQWIISDGDLFGDDWVVLE